MPRSKRPRPTQPTTPDPPAAPPPGSYRLYTRKRGRGWRFVSAHDTFAEAVRAAPCISRGIESTVKGPTEFVGAGNRRPVRWFAPIIPPPCARG